MLDTLGIKDEVVACGTPTTSVVFQNHRGKQLARYPETTILLKRGLLTRAFHEATIERGIAIEFGKRLTDVEVTPRNSVVASFGDGIGKWPNYEMPSLSTWHKGRICLIGDAVHAMSPAAGQGASMAMEDTIVLAKCLRDVSNVEVAFSTFEALRKDRVEKVATDARRNGNRKPPSNEVTRQIRDRAPVFPQDG